MKSDSIDSSFRKSEKVGERVQHREFSLAGKAKSIARWLEV